ncbi:hypothetical protein QYE76_057950 [Lolium multiflorum]|uniref:Reverse transcriptase domain-containing protein n=1 Tax=Lolium multiflorum TaxID=4521 RepID=A0AAD8WPJ1_LOLMU|nr:hypothetical protein QYE76_057950 [Lolium multiflorum]
MVAMAFQRGGQGGQKRPRSRRRSRRGQQRGDEVTTAGTRAPQTYEEYRDMPCLAHLDPATGKSTHTNRNCKWVNDLKADPEAGYKRARKHRPRGKGGKGKNKDKEEDSSEAMDADDASGLKEGSAAKPNPLVKKSAGAYHTFLGTPIRRSATYQRTMQRCLKDQIGRNVHAYVDDIAVMTRKGSDLISDLRETFENLRRYKMMLNPLKCVFGVPAGKLLGFIVSHGH